MLRNFYKKKFLRKNAGHQQFPLTPAFLPSLVYYLLLRYSSIPFAAAFPAPMARITVAAPVTASPPANTPAFEVAPFSSSAMIHFLRLISSPFVVEEISGFG